MKRLVFTIALTSSFIIGSRAVLGQTTPGVGGAAELRLNFRNASLESVLNYLSEAAGFVIDLRANVRGTISVSSGQPVTREEALQLVTSALDQNGYTALRNGRTLTIWDKESAKKRDLPVKSGNKPENIPKNDEMVTQIIPVRYINAAQVSRTLQPILPDRATMTVNEGGNCLIVTDTQTAIHRLVEILQALDTAVASVSNIRVFPLRFAEAKAVGAVLKDLFAPQETARNGGSNQGQGQTPVANTFQLDPGGPGGFGQDGPPGSGQPGGANSAAGPLNSALPIARLVAVAEERSNSLVVSASDNQMRLVEGLIKQIDVNVLDVTEFRVFRLKSADAQETVDLLTSLFADAGKSGNQNSSGQIQFGNGPFGGNPSSSGASATSGQSARSLKQMRVLAVADLRTGSVVVSAARELMVQIGKVITDLDSDASRKQQVFVYNAEHTDAQGLQEILASLFPTSSAGGTSASATSQQSTSANALRNRATQSQNQSGARSTSGSGGSSSGGRANGP